MEEAEILKKAGLTDAQVEIYSFLLKNGQSTPAEIAKNSNQSRENCYMVAKKLVELGLIEQVTIGKKNAYRLLNPSNLEILAEKRRKVVAKNEKFVKDNLSTLLDIFYANNEMPGARTLEGIEGIKEVYLDNLRVKKDLFFLRTRADKVLGRERNVESFIHEYRERRAHLGIHTYGLTPVNRVSIENAKAGRDSVILFHRTWMPENDYTAPVEIQAYGDKTALISFGETLMATIITSPVIAEAIRQILKIMMKFYQDNYKQDY